MRDVILQGGPADLPAAVRTQSVADEEQKVKIPHGAGYEHFEREVGATADDGSAVFRWTMRTRIAE